MYGMNSNLSDQGAPYFEQSLVDIGPDILKSE